MAENTIETFSLKDQIYHSSLYENVFKTHIYCLKEALKNCETVLDIGCGPNSPLKYCKNIKYSVGVEPYKDYLEESKKKGIHNKYLAGTIGDFEPKENEYDAVVMLEVLEHLTKEEGYEVLIKAEKWAKKKVVISTPNGFMYQEPVDGNDMQQHLSGWKANELSELGFKCYGLEGLRSVSSDFKEDGMYHRKEFSLINQLLESLTQLYTYYAPRRAQALFCIKNIQN